jgi:hypothetical protein
MMPRLAVGLPVAAQTLNRKARDLLVVDLAEVVAQPRNFEEMTGRIDHAPGHEIVERGAPQHSLLATGIHGDVAADA